MKQLAKVEIEIEISNNISENGRWLKLSRMQYLLYVRIDISTITIEELCLGAIQKSY